MKLSTIQKRENLNQVWAVGEKGNDEAYNTYVILKEEDGILGKILFQNRDGNLDNSVNGVLDSDLLEIVRHRLQCFQEGKFSGREYDLALTHVEEALMWLNRRTERWIKIR